MDNDSIPELFISNGTHDDATVSVYTYCDDNIVNLTRTDGGYGQNGSIKIIIDSGELVSASSSKNGFRCSLYKKFEQKLYSEIEFYYDRKNMSCSIDNEEVDSDKYTNEYNSCFKGKKMICLGYDYGCSLDDFSLIDSYKTNDDLNGEIYTSDGFLFEFQ